MSGCLLYTDTRQIRFLKNMFMKKLKLFRGDEKQDSEYENG